MKRGQAALEFLMTYGWAILAAIIIIALLAIYINPSEEMDITIYRNTCRNETVAERVILPLHLLCSFDRHGYDNMETCLGESIKTSKEKGWDVDYGPVYGNLQTIYVTTGLIEYEKEVCRGLSLDYMEYEICSGYCIGGSEERCFEDCFIFEIDKEELDKEWLDNNCRFVSSIEEYIKEITYQCRDYRVEVIIR